VERAPSRWLTVGLPLGATLLLWVLSGVLGSWGVAGQLLTATVASLLGLGPTVVFGPAVLSGIQLSTWELAALMTWTGTVVAALCSWNLDLLERIPRLGPFLASARRGAAHSLRDHRWVRRLALLGVFVFVLLPLPGSGAMGGAIVARLVGLTPLAGFLVVSLACAAVAAIYAVSATALKNWLDDAHVETAVRVGGALVILLIAWLLVKLSRWFARQAEAE
jgi:uncharacterized membrane protein